MMLWIALGLAFLGLVIPLLAIFYFAKRREKQRERAAAQKGRGER